MGSLRIEIKRIIFPYGYRELKTFWTDLMPNFFSFLSRSRNLENLLKESTGKSCGCHASKFFQFERIKFIFLAGGYKSKESLDLS